MFRWSVDQQLSEKKFFLHFKKFDGKLCWRHENNIQYLSNKESTTSVSSIMKKNVNTLILQKNWWLYQNNDVIVIIFGPTSII